MTLHEPVDELRFLLQEDDSSKPAWVHRAGRALATGGHLFTVEINDDVAAPGRYRLFGEAVSQHHRAAGGLGLIDIPASASASD